MANLRSLAIKLSKIEERVRTLEAELETLKASKPATKRPRPKKAA